MEVTLHIGNHYQVDGATWLDDRLTPQEQISMFAEYLLTGETQFKSNSPYIINYLSCALKATKDGYRAAGFESERYPVSVENVNVWQHFPDGRRELLSDYKGLPSDENILNDALGDSNEDFGRMLEWDQEWEYHQRSLKTFNEISNKQLPDAETRPQREGLNVGVWCYVLDECNPVYKTIALALESTGRMCTFRIFSRRSPIEPMVPYVPKLEYVTPGQNGEYVRANDYPKF